MKNRKGNAGGKEVVTRKLHEGDDWILMDRVW